MFKIMGGAMAILLIALVLTGRAYLSERDKGVALTQAAQISKLTIEHKEDKEDALRVQKELFDKAFKDQEDINNAKSMELTKRLVSARNDALQKPIQFGDDLWRDIIYADCVWSLQPRSDRVEGRRACLRASRNAEPSNSGLSYSVLTPTFLDGWADACREWLEVDATVREGEDDLAYTREDWDKDFGSMDPLLCKETLVALTPEASLFLASFVQNGTAYIENLITFGLEQTEAIKILTRPKRNQPE